MNEDNVATLANTDIQMHGQQPVVLPSSDAWKRECVVCSSPYVAYVRHVDTIMSKQDIPLFHCMDCKSFFNPSGYVPDEEAHAGELQFHIKVEERNTRRSEQLVEAVQTRYPDVQKILEIGSGTGTFLHVAKNAGFECVGYDINGPATSYGREQFDIDLRTEFWSSESGFEFDFLACIMVMEHLEDPRPLFDEIAKAAAMYQAKVFICVPLLERNRWGFITDPDPQKPNTPFFNNDVHVTHFSKEGLRQMARQRGSTSYEWLQTNSWSGYVFDWAERVQEQKGTESSIVEEAKSDLWVRAKGRLRKLTK